MPIKAEFIWPESQNGNTVSTPDATVFHAATAKVSKLMSRSIYDVLIQSSNDFNGHFVASSVDSIAD